jgi:hypothetical protein
MPGPLSSDQIKTVLSEIWRAREMGEEYQEDLQFLADQTKYPELEEYLEDVFFSGDVPLEQVAVRLSLFESVKQTLTRQELIGAVRRIMDVEGDEGELEELLDVVQANVPHPAVADLIYWPPEGTDLTAEEVIDRALAYRPE